MTTVDSYGSLIFCSRCGNLLDLPGDDDEIICESCGKKEDASGKLFNFSIQFIEFFSACLREGMKRIKFILCWKEY